MGPASRSTRTTRNASAVYAARACAEPRLRSSEGARAAFSGALDGQGARLVGQTASDQAARGFEMPDPVRYGFVDSETERLLAASPDFVKVAYEALKGLIVGEFGGVSYVKTIYVGFEVDGNMVAAAYPHLDRLEVALPLRMDHLGAALVDATHLTWRTRPLAYQLRVLEQIPELLEFAQEGVQRAISGQHDVNLPNEHFRRARQDRGITRPRFHFPAGHPDGDEARNANPGGRIRCQIREGLHEA